MVKQRKKNMKTYRCLSDIKSEPVMKQKAAHTCYSR